MKIEFSAISDIGPRVKNDDRVLISGKIINMDFHEGMLELPYVAVVCDGCGGHGGGGIAAQTVLEKINKKTPDILKDPSILESVLEECQHDVAEKQIEMPELSEMCTTVAGCIFGEENTIIFHSGDSRVYKYNKWGLRKMTTDHSTVEELTKMGLITEEEARNHPKKNEINRCIGVKCSPPDIYVYEAPIQPGEKYLICSDGLWGSVDDEKIKEILSSDKSAFEMAKILLETAKENGTTDNTSVCICAAEGVQTVVASEPFKL